VKIDFFVILGDPTLFELGLGIEVGDEGLGIDVGDEGIGISTNSLIKLSSTGSTAVIRVNSDDSDIEDEDDTDLDLFDISILSVVSNSVLTVLGSVAFKSFLSTESDAVVLGSAAVVTVLGSAAFKSLLSTESDAVVLGSAFKSLLSGDIVKDSIELFSSNTTDSSFIFLIFF